MPKATIEQTRLNYDCESTCKHTADNKERKCVLGCSHLSTCANYEQFFNASQKQLKLWKITRRLADSIIEKCKADECIQFCPDQDAFHAKCGFASITVSNSRIEPSLAPFREMLQRISGIALTIDSSQVEIKSAYRIASLKTHPDKTGSDGSEFMECQKAFDYLSGRQAPKDEQDLLHDIVALDQTQYAILPQHESSDPLLMDFYVRLLQIFEDPDAEFYSNSPHFKTLDGTKYWFNCAKAFMEVRFGIRKKGISHGGPLTAADLKKLQPPVGKNYHTAGGLITRFFEYDREDNGALLAASRNDEIRLNSRGWKALCYCIGHDVNTHILDPWLHAYQNLSKRERDAPMEGELPTTFKMRRVKEGRSLVDHCPEFERYKNDLIADSVVYLPNYDKDASWDTIFDGLCEKRIENAHQMYDY